LVAELIAGEIGRVLGLNVPEVVFVEVDAALGRNEPDEEIRNLLRASVGLNLSLDYLTGSVMFDRAAGDRADPDLASRTVWFDAFITSVDRTARNPNLPCWHKSLYLIDHGAALYFHHNWGTVVAVAATPFPLIRDHLLLQWAASIDEADTALRPLLTDSVLADVVELVPDAWLLPAQGVETPAQKRAAYVEYFLRRLRAAGGSIQEAIRARAERI